MSKLTTHGYDYLTEVLGDITHTVATQPKCPPVQVLIDLRNAITTLLALDQPADALLLAQCVEVMGTDKTDQSVAALAHVLCPNDLDFDPLQGVTITACDVIPNFDPECN